MEMASATVLACADPSPAAALATACAAASELPPLYALARLDAVPRALPGCRRLLSIPVSTGRGWRRTLL
jgi:hypothetical protein